MRLIDLSVAKYGRFAERKVEMADGVGLTVIYGRNEAGKSTLLEAVGDFLFGVPHTSTRGEWFDDNRALRIGASLKLANGEFLKLRRRKGNKAKSTLLDGTEGKAEAALDEGLLRSAVLGPTTRERFETLFGLSHETLRSGGEDLIEVNGEIGKLIVEAGGGLGEMVVRLEARREEAGRLFAKTYSQSREFYQALGEYGQAADLERAHRLTRDGYEQALRRAEGAFVALRELRAERVRASVAIGALERIVRVCPLLLTRSNLLDDRKAYDDVLGWPAEFSTKVKDATAARAQAEGDRRRTAEAFSEAETKAKTVSVSPDLVAAETVVVSLSGLAARVAAARGHLAKRIREREDDDVKLDRLRGMLGLSPGADVRPLAPGRVAVDDVQELDREASERKGVLEEVEGQVAELTEALRKLDAEISQDRLLGYDRLFGIGSAQFGGLVVQESSLRARRVAAARENEVNAKELDRLGVSGVEALAALGCPTPDEIRDEQTARGKIADERREWGRRQQEADERAAQAAAKIMEIKSAGEVATPEAVAAARDIRDRLWVPLRDEVLGERSLGNVDERRLATAGFEASVKEADNLADRRADEAERVALLLELVRAMKMAKGEVEKAVREVAGCDQALVERRDSFGTSFPEAMRRHPDLSPLLDFAMRRQALVERIGKAREERDAIDFATAEMMPVIADLERAEAKLGLDAKAPFDVRVRAVQGGITDHDGRHAEYARKLQLLGETDTKLKAAAAKRDGLREAERAWGLRWPVAIAALHGAATLSPKRGGELAIEWASATGVLGALKLTETRIKRMEDDEADLKRGVAEAARRLGLDLPEDGVLGAEMLQQRWNDNREAQVKLDGLLDNLRDAKIEGERAEGALGEAKKTLDGLAKAIGVAVEDLSKAAARFDERIDLDSRVASLETTIGEAGDRKPISDLEAEWANRDLDEVRAKLEDARTRLNGLDTELEGAILHEKDMKDAVAKFTGESQVTKAVAAREAATTRMHAALERYLELSMATEIIEEAMETVRAEQEDPLIARAGEFFSVMTGGRYTGIGTSVDDDGKPVVTGKLATVGDAEPEEVEVDKMSDGTSDQLFLAFRLASLERYGKSAEPLPFVADDILVHFDDLRTKATLDLLATFGEENQVLLFTHDPNVRDAARLLAELGRAQVVELPDAA